MKNYIFSSLLFLSLFITAALQADVLAEYTFTDSSFASTDASTSWTTSDLGNGVGLPLTVSATEGNPAPGIEITFGGFDYADLSASLVANGYYSFTITPDAGTELTFTDLTFEMYKQSGATATVSATIFSSIDGFATTGDAIGAGELVGGGEQSGFFLGRTVVLSSLPTVSTATEFRIYLDDGGANNSSNEFRLDNIVLNGTASVIPEPSSILLMLGASLVFMVTARRRIK
ncbi:PEP-CTERM sorting domain-containing protein [Kiritimatiellota bacterium B12222]|nr:PEP-CTERM sorting domain-containing protein [Kiritimatiellota bacterium B12222]